MNHFCDIFRRAPLYGIFGTCLVFGFLSGCEQTRQSDATVPPTDSIPSTEQPLPQTPANPMPSTGQVSNRTSPQTYNPEAEKKKASMSEYEELLRKRLLLQESILEAMEAYRTVSLKVHTQTTRIKELAGDTPPYELAQMRSKGEQIPLNLRPAFSLMQTLAPDKAYQESIIQRLDEILEEGQLEKFDRSIGFKENEILYGGILSAEQQEEIKRALNQDVVNVGTVGGIERETTEDKIWKDFEAPSAWE